MIREKIFHEGYVIDDNGKIVGEARRYDPYAHYGEIRLYEIDAFGFIRGYLHGNWSVMSKVDLLNDSKLRKELERVEYEDWKRHNIDKLKERWENYAHRYYDDFEKFCQRRFRKIVSDSGT